MLRAGLRVSQSGPSPPRPSSRKWCFGLSLPGKRAVPHPSVERCGWPWSEAAAGAWGRRDGAAGVRRRQERGRRTPSPSLLPLPRLPPKALQPLPGHELGRPRSFWVALLARPEDACFGASLHLAPPAQALEVPASPSSSSPSFPFCFFPFSIHSSASPTEPELFPFCPNHLCT